MSHLTTVGEIYAAFGAGDIPAILERLAPDVVFDPDADGTAPWLDRHEGRDGVAEFFGKVAGLEISAFEPRAFLEGSDQVAVVIHIEAVVKATGEALPTDELHLWTFGPDGLVTEMRHYVDTAGHHAAATGARSRSAA
jgi:ketosteroid isomerase-like protein